MKQPPGADQAGARVKRALCHDNPLAASLSLHQADSQGKEFLGFAADKSR